MYRCTYLYCDQTLEAIALRLRKLFFLVELQAPVCEHESRAHTVDSDIGCADFGEGLDEINLSCLANCIWQRTTSRLYTSQAGRGDERTLGRFQMRLHCLHQPEVRFDIAAIGSVPKVVVHVIVDIIKYSDPGPARVGSYDIKSAKGGDDRAHHLVDGRFVASVCFQSEEPRLADCLSGYLIGPVAGIELFYKSIRT